MKIELTVQEYQEIMLALNDRAEDLQYRYNEAAKQLGAAEIEPLKVSERNTRELIQKLEDQKLEDQLSGYLNEEVPW